MKTNNRYLDILCSVCFLLGLAISGVGLRLIFNPEYEQLRIGEQLTREFTTIGKGIGIGGVALSAISILMWRKLRK